MNNSLSDRAVRVLAAVEGMAIAGDTQDRHVRRVVRHLVARILCDAFDHVERLLERALRRCQALLRRVKSGGWISPRDYYDANDAWIEAYEALKEMEGPAPEPSPDRAC